MAADERRDEDGRRPCLRDEQRPAADEHRRRHRQEDDQAELPRAGADAPDQQVADEDADRDAGGQLDDAPRAVGDADPERDHRRDRREERARVADHVVREIPGDPGGERRLRDGQGGRANRLRALGGAG